ncbi:NADH dehydrogenase subunit 3 (mitochondrion) [Physella acuta]|uniref:NADH-ubiquinone oxidoreductase chain 3 n=1 Tax=Physella acuta TaxID=109671 RepID=V9IPN4_PHYAT|nr:NADH dehydrogenase subunit 3 [Physella acuta]AFE62772.1 NADH dehydrogenase subunit 3 [Physella acuta]
MTSHVFICMILSSALFMMYLLLSKFIMTNQNLSKLSSFECGYDTMSKMRQPFSTKFFVLIVLFVVFDIELALFFPLAYSLQIYVDHQSILILMVILLILLAGVFLEWHNGALDWKL